MAVVIDSLKPKYVVNTLTKRGEHLLAEIRRNRISYIFLAPYFVIFFTFTVIPVVMSMGLSFTSFNILETPRWIGWQNYVRLLLA